MSEAENLPLDDESAADDKGTDEATKGGDKPDTTIVDDKGDGKPVVTPTDFPADWREKMAGKDEKTLARLKRFNSPASVLKSWLAAEKKISSAAAPKPLPEDATDEVKAEWRAANGIPESWDKYDTNLGEGLVLGEDDKPIAENFMKFAHENNMRGDDVKSALKWYWTFQDEQKQNLFNADATHKEASIQTLRDEWGAEYKPNLVAIRGWLDSIDAGSEEDASLADLVFSARDVNGHLLGNDHRVLRWLAQTAKDINPAATLIPPGGANLMGLGEEIAKIEKFMATNRKDYFKDNKMQERYRQLLDAREKMSK